MFVITALRHIHLPSLLFHTVGDKSIQKTSICVHVGVLPNLLTVREKLMMFQGSII